MPPSFPLFINPRVTSPDTAARYSRFYCIAFYNRKCQCRTRAVTERFECWPLSRHPPYHGPFLPVVGVSSRNRDAVVAAVIDDREDDDDDGRRERHPPVEEGFDIAEEEPEQEAARRRKGGWSVIGRRVRGAATSRGRTPFIGGLEPRRPRGWFNRGFDVSATAVFCFKVD